MIAMNQLQRKCQCLIASNSPLVNIHLFLVPHLHALTMVAGLPATIAKDMVVNTGGDSHFGHEPTAVD